MSYAIFRNGGPNSLHWVTRAGVAFTARDEPPAAARYDMRSFALQDAELLGPATHSVVDLNDAAAVAEIRRRAGWKGEN